MKNIIITILAILLALFVWFWSDEKKSAQSLSNRLAEVRDSLKFTHTDLEMVNNNYDFLKREKDSLFTLLQSNVDKVKPSSAQYSPEEKAIHQLIFKVHNGWEDLFVKKDAEHFLSMFMPKFTTNEVTIDTKNMPHVERHNDKDFKEHITTLANTADLRIDFGDTRFLSTFIKDNIFTTTYQTRLEVKDKYKTVQASNIICYVSGEKYQGEWKIGNYNWTRYDAMEYLY